MFIASIIFLLAITTACYAIVVSVTNNIERIYEVIEQRSGDVVYSRKITIGALRSPIIKPVISSNAKSRRPITTKRGIPMVKMPQRQWSVAA